MKNKKTFAQRAKEIKSRYKRAAWDKIEERDMLNELAALREEQEAVREEMGMGEGSGDDMNKDGYSNTQFLNKSSYIPNYFEQTIPVLPKMQFDPLNANLNSFNNKPNSIAGKPNNITRDNFVPNKITNWNRTPDITKPNNNLAKESPAAFSRPGGSWRTPQTSIVPFAISAGMSAIGDIAGLISNKNNKPEQISAPHISPANISLQPEREAMSRELNTTRNMVLRGSRDVSSPSNAYANEIAGMSGVLDSYGTSMGKSYMNEQNINAQNRMAASERNAEMDLRTQTYNTELQDRYTQRQQGRMDSLFNTIPMGLRDYRQQVNEQNTINNMGKDYGMQEFIPDNETPLQKFRRQLLGAQTRIRPRQAQ